MMTSLLSGRVKEGFDLCSDDTFDDKNPFYRNKPTEADMVHCVIYIVDICSVGTLDQSFIDMIRNLQKKQIKPDIQRILILTKCDQLCDHVKRDVRQIFHSKRVFDEINRAKEKLCFHGGIIHPIVNYGEHITKIKPDMNVPILLALKQCMNFSNEFMKKCVADSAD
ncbi:uncharacterized protein LOC132758154 [Ruditapes philippinarum]|uniref:uncharacterized protein LOC132758154 n=1 Tax=Ruditapes philippinarum TaxID=129788 RepID=UPI00295A9B88|nr:uncharacterized protein LOC132758154 [Ruditapes philippinarum]